MCLVKNNLLLQLLFYLFLDLINKTLIKRRAGIAYVEINGHKLENIHDILQITDSADASSYKINGKQLLYEDIHNNLDVNSWPVSARPHVKKGGHYVYFKTNRNTSSFLLTKIFRLSWVDRLFSN